ncbi:MFS transporter [Caldovatus sediminis]|uniref:MFS transporter n=1 Tax=Caldovatus sediminis TaxID=2041189 RepID=A0A8J2Z7K3_9PROT|nr:tripartite tricarboxylate transporter substrate binding protein [Caldovatus sediminis]GGG18379.1 MFS transporter [Caldovatus sediminis]
MKRQSLLRGALALPGLAAAAGAARAEEYPSGPIRIVVPYAAGGIADVLARLVGARLEANWRNPVVVENRPGANGTIAQQFVARARPDGHTLLLGNTGTQVVNRFLYRNLPFDLEKDFQPIGLIASTPMLLVVAPSHPANSVAELVAMARAAPGRMNFGSAGNGSASHLALAMLASKAGIEIAHIPYRGTSAILPDLVGGRLQAYFDVPITALGPIRAGTIKPLGIASLQRQPALPDVPAIAETIPGFEIASWLGLFAPAGLPPERTQKLNRELRAILAEPDFRRQLVEQGNEVLPNTPEEFDAFIRREATRIAEVVAAAGIRAE